MCLQESVHALYNVTRWRVPDCISVYNTLYARRGSVASINACERQYSTVVFRITTR